MVRDNDSNLYLVFCKVGELEFYSISQYDSNKKQHADRIGKFIDLANNSSLSNDFNKTELSAARIYPRGSSGILGIINKLSHCVPVILSDSQDAIENLLNELTIEQRCIFRSFLYKKNGEFSPIDSNCNHIDHSHHRAERGNYMEKFWNAVNRRHGKLNALNAIRNTLRFF